MADSNRLSCLRNPRRASDDEARDLGTQAGADEILVVPAPIEELAGTIQNTLERLKS